MVRKKEEDEQLILELRKLIDLSFYSLIPIAVLFLVMGWLSNSLTVIAIAFDSGLSFIVQIFAFMSIRTIQSSNVLKFPYGTGKLENFSSFLYGALAIPTSLYIIFFAVTRFLGPPEDVSFTLAMIPFVLSLIRSLYLFYKARKLHKTSDSPMVRSYFINFKITAIGDIALIVAISIGSIVTILGHGRFASYLDPAFSLLVATYLLYNGVTLTVGNFKVLVDLPLEEKEQLKIMNVLAQEFEHYENIGNIFTRRSGRRRFIDIELYVREDMSVKDVSKLKKRLNADLEKQFEDVRFNLIPLSYEKYVKDKKKEGRCAGKKESGKKPGGSEKKNKGKGGT